MADDIVTRLREAIDPNAIAKIDSLNDICLQAADEIESLRRTNKLWMGLWEDCVERQKSTENGTVVTERWRKIATELYTWLLPSDEDDSVREAGLDAMAMYDEAVRGE